MYAKRVLTKAWNALLRAVIFIVKSPFLFLMLAIWMLMTNGSSATRPGATASEPSRPDIPDAGIAKMRQIGESLLQDLMAFVRQLLESVHIDRNRARGAIDEMVKAVPARRGAAILKGMSAVGGAGMVHTFPSCST